MAGGAKVTVYDAKLSVGRKFLVAGRGGLNLTHTEAKEPFVLRYSGGKDAGALWNSLLDDFNSEALRNWAKELGVETFVATTGRVYPKEMKTAEQEAGSWRCLTGARTDREVLLMTTNSKARFLLM